MELIVTYICIANIATGAALCGLGFISASITSVLDKYGMKLMGQTTAMKVDSKKVVSKYFCETSNEMKMYNY